MHLTEEEVQVVVIRGKHHVHICGAKRGLHYGGKSWANVNLGAWDCSCAQRRSQKGDLHIWQMMNPSKASYTFLLGCADSSPAPT